MSEYEHLKAQYDAMKEKQERPARIGQEAIEFCKWLAGQSDLLFAECSLAEEIVSRARSIAEKDDWSNPVVGRD